MKVRNRFWDRRKRPLVLPKTTDKWVSPIPTAMLLMKIELIDGYQVLEKMVIGDQWCFIIVESKQYSGNVIRIISFDENGNEFDFILDDQMTRRRAGFIIDARTEATG